MSSSSRELGTGPLSLLALSVARHALLALCLVLALLPALVATFLLGSEVGNVGWVVMAQIPVVPALSAGLFAVRAWRRNDDAGVWREFWRGYRLNLRDTLRWWVPTLVAGSMLALAIAFADSVPGGPLIRPVAAAIAVVLLLWSGQALLISSFFAFRTRDVARIAAAMLFQQWRVTLVLVSLTVVAAAVVVIGSEVLLALLAWAFVSLLEVVARPLVEQVTTQFTQQPEA